MDFLNEELATQSSVVAITKHISLIEMMSPFGWYVCMFVKIRFTNSYKKSQTTMVGTITKAGGVGTRGLPQLNLPG